MFTLLMAVALATPQANPARDDAAIQSVMQKLDLAEVDEKAEPCLPGNRGLWGDWHARVACGQDVDLSTIAVRLSPHRDDYRWTVWIDRVDLGGNNGVSREAKVALVQFMTDENPNGPGDTRPRKGCPMTAVFADDVVYTVRTFCSANAEHEHLVGDWLLDNVAVTVNGIRGIRGRTDGVLELVRRPPPPIEEPTEAQAVTDVPTESTAP